MAANWLMTFVASCPLQNTIPDNPGICDIIGDNIDIATVT